MDELDGELRKINRDNIRDIICCPGGLEVKDANFCGDISGSLRWREEMLKSGLEGYIFYQEGIPTGFVEYISIDSAPYPVEGKNLAFIMCFHWKPLKKEKEEHLDVEWKLLDNVIDKIKEDYEGAAALAWDHPVHFPIEMFEKLGFTEVSSVDSISLMWRPFSDRVEPPAFTDTVFELEELSKEGKLSIELGYSSRCPYSIHDYNKVKKVVSELESDKIVFHTHKIDTRRDAFETARKSWSWNWLFLNGKEIDHMWKSEEELKDIIEEELERLD